MEFFLDREKEVEISPNLLIALGLGDETNCPEPIIITDWKAPDNHGLSNSIPVIQQPKRSSVSVQNRSSKETNSQHNNSTEKPVDIEDEMEMIEFFLNRDREVEMSRSLLVALGISDGNNSPEPITDWEAPEYHGLSNSLPIIQKPKRSSVSFIETPVENISLNNNSTEKPIDIDDEMEMIEFFLNRDRDVEMSRGLLVALGICDDNSNSHEAINITDWEAPEYHGLNNSLPIIETSGYEASMTRPINDKIHISNNLKFALSLKDEMKEKNDNLPNINGTKENDDDYHHDPSRSENFLKSRMQRIYENSNVSNNNSIHISKNLRSVLRKSDSVIVGKINKDADTPFIKKSTSTTMNVIDNDTAIQQDLPIKPTKPSMPPKSRNKPPRISRNLRFRLDKNEVYDNASGDTDFA